MTVWFAGYGVDDWEHNSRIYGPFISEDVAYQAIEVWYRNKYYNVKTDWQVFSREVEDGSSGCPLIDINWRDDDDEDD